MTQQVTGNRPLPSQERRTAEPFLREAGEAAGFGFGWVGIREANEQTGVPVSTLRYWAREGHVSSQLDLSGVNPRRLVALDEVIRRAQRRRGAQRVVDMAPSGPPGPPPRSRLAPSQDQRVPEGAMIVPIDAWNKMLNQLGNLHEAGRQLAEARERAARAETEARFLRERLSELRVEMSDLRAQTTTVAETQPQPVPPLWLGVYRRLRGLRR
ncbi:MAG TPA: MerR family transcriptional regulator [Acidimicrobiia bacterium]